jgi:hypothetical protein
LLQAAEYFPEEYEVEYRLAGFHFLLHEEQKATFHLSNGLRLNLKQQILFAELFPTVWERTFVQDYILKHTKSE